MIAFLQAYGGWIIFGVLLILMFRMHSGGQGGHGGCGMGMSHEDERQDHTNHTAVIDQRQDHTDWVVPLSQSTSEEARFDATRQGSGWAPADAREAPTRTGQ